jgi:hypothetical protein
MHLSENRVTPESVIVDHHFSIKRLPQIGGTWPILKPTSYIVGLKMVGNPPHCIPIAFEFPEILLKSCEIPIVDAEISAFHGELPYRSHVLIVSCSSSDQSIRPKELHGVASRRTVRPQPSRGFEKGTP